MLGASAIINSAKSIWECGGIGRRAGLKNLLT